MNTDDLEKWGAGLARQVAGFLAGLQASSPEPVADKDASSGTRTIIFLMDEAAKLLDRISATLTSENAAQAASSGGAPPLPGRGMRETLEIMMAQVLRQPELFARHYAEFASEALNILRDDSNLAPQARDFRFKDPLWLESRFLRVLVQLYLAWNNSVQGWLSQLSIGEADRRRIEFLFKQLVAAFAPSNFPLNPAALRRAERTNGTSVVDGLGYWMQDIAHNYAMPRQVRPDAYCVGKDLAITEGGVVHRSEQLELIQFTPLTGTVRRRPVLIVPPQINKYYGFDLRPSNSIIRHLLLSGLQVFVLSWRNPTQEHAGWNLDAYVRAALDATDAIAAITMSRTMGLISGCAGGLTAMAMLGYLAEIGDRRVVNHSLLVTCILPNKGSDAELFATRDMLELSRSYVRAQGVMQGQALAKVFFWLRPNELIWRYWINNYLLGKSPPSLDVLYWDSDSTRLPAALHSDFLDMYADDVFQRCNALEVLGRGIDFNKVKIDSYFLGGEDDYLMPWKGCYDTCQLFRGRHQFVLSTGGHLQVLLRPPHLANTVYYTNEDLSLNADDWRRTAIQHEGTWWQHWHRWLNEKSGALKRAPRSLGNDRFPITAPAPGRYVHE
jgi:poly[(R)-3-hydroxyalkanoate] polymerase subunit PhaC